MPDSPGIPPLTAREFLFLTELVKQKTRFMIVGMASAVLQGADAVTKDIDLWFDIGQGEKIEKAASSVGATYYWRGNPPSISGGDIESLDLVNHCSGLGYFSEEYRNAIDMPLDKLKVKILPIERVLVSKRSAGRKKDLAAIPLLDAAIAAKEQ